jgi:triacylglycerol lipase
VSGKGHPGPLHTDWLSSGARFNRVRFDVVMDRIVSGMVVAEELSERQRDAVTTTAMA